MDHSSTRPPWVLPVIVASQFMGTSLWFAGNAVIPELAALWRVEGDVIGLMTSAVQFGFIIGTLTFSILALADRVSPTRLYFFCSLLGAAANFGVLMFASHYAAVLLFRFFTGFLLAGIYPVGMKIASGWFKQGLGNALGWLVGATVMGTASPFLLSSLGQRLPWDGVLFAVSTLAALGGVLMLLFVRDAPGGTLARFEFSALPRIFRQRDFRRAAYGYFGHMWELYAFWAYTPFFIGAYFANRGSEFLDPQFWTFAVIGIGSLGCILSGLTSLRFGSGFAAAMNLGTSALCCLLSPLLFFAPPAIFLTFMLLWGIAVVGDSGQLSALNAQNAPSQLVGTALTIATSIGFAVTIVSIQLLSWIATVLPPAWLFLPLAPGPIFGLYAIFRIIKKRR